MAKKGKRYAADKASLKGVGPLPLAEAVKRVKAFKPTKFDQTVELCMHLGIDPKQADQMIRGSVSLPHGIGKSKRVIAFCTPDKVDEAKAAGAIEAGGEELVKKIEDGWFDFDVAVASPDMMRVVSKLGRVLGPKGLMPSPKSGTVTPNVAEAVKEYAAGKVEFRNDSGGNIHAAIGKHSFGEKELEENAQAFIKHISRLKPSSAKGQYIKSISLSATMTPGVPVEVAS
ncbi:MAG: 50S ribosomal protein L1 [Phycisphaeraceae bacterium]